MVTFAVYVGTRPDHTLKASVCFVALSLFDLLAVPLHALPNIVSHIITVSFIGQIAYLPRVGSLFTHLVTVRMTLYVHNRNILVFSTGSTV